jgi:hypothetical protein
MNRSVHERPAKPHGGLIHSRHHHFFSTTCRSLVDGFAIPPLWPAGCNMQEREQKDTNKTKSEKGDAMKTKSNVKAGMHIAC